MIEYNITPAQFLREIGWSFTSRGKWLGLKSCPFCGGGNQRDVFTFAVHSIDGNYFCHRSKCGEKGSFWALIKSQNLNPADYQNRDSKKGNSKKGKKKFIYGR